MVIRICLLLVLLNAGDLVAQVNPYSGHTEPEELAMTFGYCNGQEFGLAYLKENYPQYYPQLYFSFNKFKARFGQASREIEGILEENDPGGFLDQMRNQGKSELSSIYRNMVVTQEDIQAICKDWEARAKGDIPSPMLETLLMYHPSYSDDPAREFLDGYTKRFLADGHPKAFGLDLQLDYPSSWGSREGRGADILQFFRSRFGRGDLYLIIGIEDFAVSLPTELRNLQREEWNNYVVRPMIEEVFGDNFIGELMEGMGARDVEVWGRKFIVNSGWPGVQIDSRYFGLHLDRTLPLYNRMYFFLVGGHLVTAQFQVPQETGESFEEQGIRFKKLDTLFGLVANSFVFNN